MRLLYQFTTLMGKYIQKILPTDLVFPILTGKLRGTKWIIGCSNLEYGFGTYEYKKRILFEQKIPNNSIVYDIGAHVGFYTLLASKLVGQEGKVVSFEPFSENFVYLKEHVEMNELKNVILNNVAVADFDGYSQFNEGKGTSTGLLSEDGNITVETISLDSFIKKNPDLIPNYLKIDVEGAEFSVFTGSEYLIKHYHPKIFLATHNNLVHKKCVDFLNKYNYKLHFINNRHKEIFAF